MSEDTQVTAPVTETPSVEVESSGSGDDFDFDSFSKELAEAPPEQVVKEVKEPVTPTVTTPAATVPTAPTTTAAPTVAAPVVAPTPQVQVAPASAPKEVQPAVAPAAAQAATQPSEEVDPFTDIDRRIEAARGQVLDVLAQQQYGLSEDEVNQVLSDPGVAIPKLLAKVHVNAVQGVIRHVAQQLPATVNAIIQAQAENTKRSEAFFDRWPQLKDKEKYGGQIMTAARMFRQMNPQASAEQLIAHVGAQVMLVNGMTAQAVAPAAPVQTRPVTTQAPPFTPAGAGQAGGVQAQVTSKDPWSEFIEVMNEG